MNKVMSRSMVLAAAIAVAGASQAVTFSNFVITGDASVIGALGVDHFVNTSSSDVDFTFNKAWVGDNLPLRQSTISITYLATAGANEVITGVALAGNALALGSGIVSVSEIVEDLNDFTNGGTTGVVVTSSTSGSFNSVAQLTRPATHIKVKKTIFLDATPNTQAVDLAAIGLVEQRVLTTVPEPATMAALGLGIAAMVRRRRSR